jgi:hypothetical protein
MLWFSRAERKISVEPNRAGAPEEITITVGEIEISLPRVAFEDGARRLFLLKGIYVGTGDYALSVEEFLSALKGNRISSIQF